MQDTRSCRPRLQTCSTYYPALQYAVENLVQEFGATSPTLNLTSCFVSSDYYQSNARSQVCRSDKCAAVCSIHCTSLQDPGHAGGMLELQLKKKLTYSAEFRVPEAKFSFVLLISAAVRWEQFVSSGGSQRLD